MRGKMNHSGYLHYTAETVAEQLGMDAQEFAHVSAQNAKRLFNIA